MKVTEASLTLRFYRSDGWTRKEVARALDVPIGVVSCRVWNMDWDRAFEVYCKENPEFDDPVFDYYAVYDMDYPALEPRETTIRHLEEQGHEVSRFRF